MVKSVYNDIDIMQGLFMPLGRVTLRYSDDGGEQ